MATATITTLQLPPLFFFFSRSELPLETLHRRLVSFPISTSRRRMSGGAAAVVVVVGVRKYKGTAMREEKLAEMIEKKVAEAIEVCEGGDDDSDGCRVAWDEVEEVSQAKAHLRRKLADTAAADPLQYFCEENPETDECTIYED